MRGRERVMFTCINGKIVHAILQRQVYAPAIFHNTDNWEDVRELEVTPDGKIVLSTSPGIVEVPQTFQDAFTEGELNL